MAELLKFSTNWQTATSPLCHIKFFSFSFVCFRNIAYLCRKMQVIMDNNNLIDGAEYITLEDAKHVKLPYFEGLAAGFSSPASYSQHENLDLNEKFVHHAEASYFVRVKGESMIGLGILDGDICLVDRSEEIADGNIVVAYVNGGLTVRTLDTSTHDKGHLRLMPHNPDFKPIIIDANDQFILQGKVTSIHRDTRKF
jgi:DNA polymerase V